MRCTTLLKLFLAGLLLSQPASAQQLPDIIGTARDSSGQTILYQEHYYCEPDASACSVFYLDPAQQLIASKVIDYQPSLQAPSLLFIDYRSDREVVVQGPGTVDDLVIDAGFDNYIRKRWQQLQSGATAGPSLATQGHAGQRYWQMLQPWWGWLRTCHPSVERKGGM